MNAYSIRELYEFAPEVMLTTVSNLTSVTFPVWGWRDAWTCCFVVVGAGMCALTDGFVGCRSGLYADGEDQVGGDSGADCVVVAARCTLDRACGFGS
ncbi:hypothetical protein LAUMK142_03238 [Mycobacterium pseudokansasii]|uniref:Uncharacterized protein n=1 Tax=Mycobacterium pseudokansasii TaxID=2341080 RepID=A0A498QQ88_9MYCO|nr:hypothetical protein LAUMK142_03238 [Mycobacterium pseudokansasii]